MTATTTARESKRKDGQLIAYPMAAVKIPRGTLVNIGCDGYAKNAESRLGEKFAGLAYETVDNSEGEPGDLSIRVETTGTFLLVDFNGDGDQKDVGKEFTIIDNQTVTDGINLDAITVGIAVESVSKTCVRIRIDKFAS